MVHFIHQVDDIHFEPGCSAQHQDIRFLMVAETDRTGGTDRTINSFLSVDKEKRPWHSVLCSFLVHPKSVLGRHCRPSQSNHEQSGRWGYGPDSCCYCITVFRIRIHVCCILWTQTIIKLVKKCVNIHLEPGCFVYHQDILLLRIAEKQGVRTGQGIRTGQCDSFLSADKEKWPWNSVLCSFLVHPKSNLGRHCRPS